jgi:hypothetical protein
LEDKERKEEKKGEISVIRNQIKETRKKKEKERRKKKPKKIGKSEKKKKMFFPIQKCQYSLCFD